MIKSLCVTAFLYVGLSCTSSAVAFSFPERFWDLTNKITLTQDLPIPKSKKRDFTCLALALYHESRGSTQNEQYAVGLTILNRIMEKPRSICQIVWEKGQFPWVKAKNKRLIPTETKEWDIAQHIAYNLLFGDYVDFTNGADMFYDCRKVHPNWVKDLITNRLIGTMCFGKIRPVIP